MIKFICDTCGKESESNHRDKVTNELIPSGWITINNSDIFNDKEQNRKLIRSGAKDFHLCSKDCLVGLFFYEEEMDIDKTEDKFSEQVRYIPSVSDIFFYEDENSKHIEGEYLCIGHGSNNTVIARSVEYRTVVDFDINIGKYKFVRKNNY